MAGVSVKWSISPCAGEIWSKEEKENNRDAFIRTSDEHNMC